MFNPSVPLGIARSLAPTRFRYPHGRAKALTRAHAPGQDGEDVRQAGSAEDDEATSRSSGSRGAAGGGQDSEEAEAAELRVRDDTFHGALGRGFSLAAEPWPRRGQCCVLR